MKRSHLIPVLVLFAIIVSGGIIFAQNATLTGTVEVVERRVIGVRQDDGNFVYFQVGWRTKYHPDRLPHIGERVQVSYSVDGQFHIGYAFNMLPPSPPPPSTPPPPPSPYVGPKDPYRGK